MNKKKRYDDLIKRRQDFNFSKIGLKNYSLAGHKDDFVDSWEEWQCDLDADIMLIGQDYSDWKYYKKERESKDNKVFKENPTNKKLIELFKVLGYNISIQSRYQERGLFFTNAVVGLKDGGNQGKVEKEWWKESAKEFLKPLIKNIQPKIIITLGRVAFDAVGVDEDINIGKPSSLKNIINAHTYYQINSSKVFPVYHCGVRGIQNRAKVEGKEYDGKTINEKFELQKSDWRKIKETFFKV